MPDFFLCFKDLFHCHFYILKAESQKKKSRDTEGSSIHWLTLHTTATEEAGQKPGLPHGSRGPRTGDGLDTNWCPCGMLVPQAEDLSCYKFTLL